MELKSLKRGEHSVGGPAHGLDATRCSYHYGVFIGVVAHHSQATVVVGATCIGEGRHKVHKRAIIEYACTSENERTVVVVRQSLARISLEMTVLLKEIDFASQSEVACNIVCRRHRNDIVKTCIGMMCCAHSLAVAIGIAIVCADIKIREATVADIVYTDIKQFETCAVAHSEVARHAPCVVDIGSEFVFKTLVILRRAIKVCIFLAVVHQFAWIGCHFMIILRCAAGVIDIAVQLVYAECPIVVCRLLLQFSNKHSVFHAERVNL